VLASLSAAEIMSSDLISVRPDMPLLQALTEMLVHGISCLPVLADDKLVGILTNTDMNTVLEVLLQTAQAAVAGQSDGQTPAERMADLVAEQRSR
jgi:predicted transcriptional regulator